MSKKKFAPRISKHKRGTIALPESLNPDLFKASDEKLLRGAELGEIRLADIRVKEQVRTKFNDDSLRELAENIRSNGLIQPLVVHFEGEGYTLICGERRYRAMSLIDMEKCPCFILQNKTHEELMAIQFSENSSREALHYIDTADGILNYQKATQASERKITAALGISKSEVHRSLIVSRLPGEIKEAAKRNDVEKYVLLEYDALPSGKLKKQIRQAIVDGQVTKRVQLKRLLNSQGPSKSASRSRKNPSLPPGTSANVLLKALNNQAKNLDPAARKQLEGLLQETREMMN